MRQTMLGFPDMNKPTLYTDASETTVSAMLLQDESSRQREENFKPIYFLSHRLSESQRKWHINEKEAHAIVHGLHTLINMHYLAS